MEGGLRTLSHPFLPFRLTVKFYREAEERKKSF